MQITLESLVALATIVGTATSILALIQSRAWLVFTSLLFVSLSIIVGLYARKKRLTLNAASNEIEGHSIDSLMLSANSLSAASSNLRRGLLADSARLASGRSRYSDAGIMNSPFVAGALWKRARTAVPASMGVNWPWPVRLPAPRRKAR
jgi:hypothetical protein